MSVEIERRNRLMLRARDRMDRTYADPLDIRALARVAKCSPAHFIRKFRAVFAETPHRYLQRRRVERAMSLLRNGRNVTDVCFEVGFNSLGTFSRTFTAIVGVSPSVYRQRSSTVAITQEPVTHFYGTDIGIRDPFGNHIRIVQPADQAPR